MYSKPASECNWTELSKLVNDAFEGYMGATVSFKPDALEAWFPANFISPANSHIFYPSSSDEGTEPIALVLIAERDDRPGEARVAAMAVVPAYQGKGTGSRALQMTIEAEKQRGTRLLELECIQTNERGLKLYTRTGFSKYREIWGWHKTASSSAAPAMNPSLQQCAIHEVDAILRAYAAPDLPWQARGMARLADPGLGFRLEHAYCAIAEPTDNSDTINVFCLIVEPAWRGLGQGRRLAEAMMAKYPSKKFLAKPIFPREYGEGFAKALASLGVETIEIKQFQMRMEL